MLDLILRGGVIVSPDGLAPGDLAVVDGRIAALLAPGSAATAQREIAVDGCYLLPGLVDAHVHFREPGLTAKEDFASGSRAAIAGGVTTALVMPTDDPWTQTLEQLAAKRALAEGRIHADVGLQVVLGRPLAELDQLVELGAVSFELFTADVPPEFRHATTAEIEKAMLAVARAGGLVAVSPDDESVLEQRLAKAAPGRRDIDAFIASRPPLAEATGIARAVLAAASTGARVHVRQTGSALGIAAFRRLKSLADVTVETSPQCLLFDRRAYARFGRLIKASPPLREASDRLALQAALADGTIDLVASDHAPHSLADKQAPADFMDVPGGMPGVQTLLFALLHLVERGIIGLPDVARLVAETPAHRFGLGHRKGRLAVGFDADIVVLDPTGRTTVQNRDQLSKPGYTVFDGLAVPFRLDRVLLRGVEVVPADQPRGEILASVATAGRDGLLSGPRSRRSGAMSTEGAGRIEAEATVSWSGWGGKVTGGSGKLHASTATQTELGGPGQATNPEELLAAALANCYTSTITARARARKIELAHIEATARTRLAWGETAPHHIAEGALAVRIRSRAPEATVRQLAEEARDHCPICNLLGATATVTLAVSVIGD